MPIPLHVLLIEDSADDALLLMHELARGDFDAHIQRVETEDEMTRALQQNSWDVVIADFILPRFSGLDALNALKGSGLDLPIIIVSGKIGEDIAVEAMRAGVRDYITKDNLARLVPAVKRELKEAGIRREHRKAQFALEKAREQMERQSRHEQEMKLLGQLVSGVAHEVRNPLNAITALLEALFLELGESDLIAPYRRHIEAQVERLNRLMQDLLELGKPSNNEQFSEINIADLCKTTIELWNQAPVSTASKIDLIDNSPGEILIVLGDPTRLQQVLINLIENASEHNPERKPIELHIGRSDNSARIAIVDKGTGIKPEYLGLIFDPFFTTRKAGTGLGLGIARRIVEAHDGSIQVRNNDPAPGVTAEVVLPLFTGKTNS